jgi:hypothetical protein
LAINPLNLIIIIIIIIIITGKTAHFQPYETASLRRFCQIASGFHLFGFRTSNCFTEKVVSLASHSQPGGPGPYI